MKTKKSEHCIGYFDQPQFGTIATKMAAKSANPAARLYVYRGPMGDLTLVVDDPDDPDSEPDDDDDDNAINASKVCPGSPGCP